MDSEPGMIRRYAGLLICFVVSIQAVAEEPQLGPAVRGCGLLK
jgi:hypothetical protein